MTRRETTCTTAGQEFSREVSAGDGVSPGKRSFQRAPHVLHTDGFQALRWRFGVLPGRLQVLACSIVQVVMVGGAGGDEFVVAFLGVSSTVEELLFEFGDSLMEGADFVGSGESGVVDDLCAKDFGQPLGELGVLVSESFVVFAV
jgi:hypothetical protein